MWLLVSKKDRLKEFGVEGVGKMFGIPPKSDRKDDDLDEKTYLVNENSIKSIEKVPSHTKKRTKHQTVPPRTFTDTYFRFNLYYNDGSKDELVEIHSKGDLEFYMSETESEKQYLKEIVKTG